ncbi:MAG TPA: amino acid permease [Solirubrobacteraceae bacterium]|nr:amino acid permease [Solirubrobacteraceae bacterium]
MTRPTVSRQHRRGRVISGRALALIILAAVLTLHNMPAVAEYGWASATYYLLGALIFLIPLSMVVGELGAGWPRAGGNYAWVREAFGDRHGLFAIWVSWVTNLSWFPVVLSFLAATVAYVFAPSLAENRLYVVLMVVGVLWALTFANFLGTKWALRLNNPGVVLGTLFPCAVLVALAVYWLCSGRHSQIPFTAGKLVPDLSSIGALVFFIGVILGYVGVEAGGFYAKEVQEPKRDYPRAIAVATALIVGASIFATLAIALVVPHSKLSLVAGIPQAFTEMFRQVGAAWAGKLMSALVALGTLALVSTWVLAPSKGLYATEPAADLPPWLHRVNRRHVPVALLVLQGILSTVFALLFLIAPGVNTSFWMLTALTTQMVLLMYILVFAAAIKLRYSRPEVERAYKVPGGTAGMWAVAGIGVAGCVFSFVLGFVPPSEVKHWPTPIYVAVMAVAIVVMSVPPFIIERVKKPSWVERHPDTVLLDAAPASAPAESKATAQAGVRRGEPGADPEAPSRAPPGHAG